MGFVSRLRSVLGLAKEPVKLLVVGLDDVGKTTILYKIKQPLDNVVTTIPTIGFNMETMQHREISFTAWGVGGRDKIRPLLRHFWQGTHGLIFVVDSSDRDRVERAREELHKMLREADLSDMVLLVFANKQDLPDAMNVREVTDKLGLHSLRHRQWYIQSSCAVSGDGLYEGLDWLSSTIAKHSADHKVKSHRITEACPAGRVLSGLFKRLQALSSSNLMSSKFWLSLM